MIGISDAPVKRKEMAQTASQSFPVLFNAQMVEYSGDIPVLLWGHDDGHDRHRFAENPSILGCTYVLYPCNPCGATCGAN